MSDLSLAWAGDISLDATGDLATSTGTQELQERMIRRFLTNALITDTSGNVTSVPDYIWDQTYGGNARAFVDAVVAADTIPAIQNRFLDQARQETEVVQTPPPVVQVTQVQNGLQLNATVVLRTGEVVLIPQLEVTN